MSIFEDEKHSEHEEPSVKAQISQRAKEEENRIISRNRQSAPRDRINSQQWTNNDTENIPHESIIVGTISHQPQVRASSSEKHQTPHE